MKNLVDEKIEEKKLRQTSVDYALVHGHLNKAYHNIEVMRSLNRFNSQKPEGWVVCRDWVVTAGYYGMYHSALALLALRGWRSEDHDATIAMLKYLYVYREGKLTLAEVNKLEKARTLLAEMEKLGRAKRIRKTASYDVDIMSEGDVDFILKNSPPFVDRMHLLSREVLGYDLLSR